jgi:hypothetical protein
MGGLCGCMNVMRPVPMAVAVESRSDVCRRRSGPEILSSTCLVMVEGMSSSAPLVLFSCPPPPLLPPLSPVVCCWGMGAKGERVSADWEVPWR